MGQQEGGFLEAGERAGESTGSIRSVGMEFDKLEEEDAFKFEDERQQPEDRSAGEEEGEQAGREDDGEEGSRAKGMTAFMELSDKEREEHELTHTPFRAWCPYCVRARGRNMSHLKNQDINKDRSNETEDEHGLLMSKEDESECEPDHGDGGREDWREVRARSRAQRIGSSEEDESRMHHRYAVVVQDLLSGKNQSSSDTTNVLTRIHARSGL